MGAAHVHVYRGLFRAPTEKGWLWEDGYAGEPLPLGVEPALRRCVAVPGL